MLKLLVVGRNGKEIAANLAISPESVREHVQEVYAGRKSSRRDSVPSRTLVRDGATSPSFINLTEVLDLAGFRPGGVSRGKEGCRRSTARPASLTSPCSASGSFATRSHRHPPGR